MHSKVLLIAALLTAPAILAQSSTGGDDEKPKAYVRRFSAGATFTVLGLGLVPNHTTTSSTTSPAVAGTYYTTGASQRIGYGITATGAITGHFALNASLLYRRIGYLMTSDVYLGTLDPNATTDTRTRITNDEDTRAHLFDLPVVVRWYNLDRHTRGTRWFAEGGGVLRRVSNIRTSIDQSVDSGTTTCCTTTPAAPAHRTTRGFVAGLGFQAIDPFGIRVVPEVRYTRWLNQTFSSYSTGMQRNQLEINLSVTF